ncbi:MAG: hypothetical protein ACHQHN_13415 [Sphingobacteriales bacterium]
MKNYYYLFWSDAIQRFIKHHPKEKGREKKPLLITSWVFTLVVLSTMLWLKYFHIYQSKIGIFGIFTTVEQNISFILDMGLVFLLIYIINYLLIFWQNRYVLFIDRYPLGRFNYSLFVTIAMLGYFLFTIFLYGYLSGQM